MPSEPDPRRPSAAPEPVVNPRHHQTVLAVFKPRVLVPAFAFAAVVGLAGCKAPVSFKVLDPEKPRKVLADDRQGFARQLLATGIGAVGETPERALGPLLAAAQQSLEPALAGDPEQREIYNRACAEAAAALYQSPETTEVAAGGSVYQIRVRQGEDLIGLAEVQSLIPSSRVRISNVKKLGGRVTEDGVGGAMVGTLTDGDANVSNVGLSVALTAVWEFEGEVATLSLFEVAREDDRTVDGREVELAADFTAPLAAMVSRGERKGLGLRAMLRPEAYEAETGLYFAEPFDPEAIPVVFVHGLGSAPRTWLNTHTALAGDERLREAYQFWVYRYSTGFGLGRNAMDFRVALSEVVARHPGAEGLNQMVLVGHSMGGLLSSAMIRSSRERIEEELLEVPIEELDLDDAAREDLRKVIEFEAQPFISRVVFIATPHRGSEIASKPLGRLGVRLIKVSSNLLQLQRPEVIKEMRAEARIWLGDHGTSIESLKPDSWRLRLLNSLPMSDRVTYHSIIGDRGKGDTPDSSDGVVPYWSSHLEGAASELIVPSDHSAQRHPQAHAELKRILHLHLDGLGR